MASTTTLDPARATEYSMPKEVLFEVVRGNIVELPPMSIYSIWVANRLKDSIGPFVRKHKLGNLVIEAMFIVDVKHDERRRPDLAFVSAQTWPLSLLIPETGDWEVVPDLAVEVISPSELFEDVIAKVEEYFQFGVKQVWLVLPRRKRLYIYDSPTQMRILTSADELDGGEMFPGLRLPLAPIFQRSSDNGSPME